MCAFGCAECLPVVRDAAAFFGAQDGWFLAAVAGGEGPADQRARRSRWDRGGAEFVEGGVEGIVDCSCVTVLPEVDSKSTCSFPMISSAASVCVSCFSSCALRRLRRSIYLRSVTSVLLLPFALRRRTVSSGVASSRVADHSRGCD